MNNMTADLHVFESVSAFSLVVVSCIIMKKKSIVREEDAALCARLLTQAALPAFIFFQLSTHPLSSHQFLMVLAMVVTGIISMGAAWLAGKALRFDRQKIGALLLTSSFGSTALIGYPLIQFSFPNNPEALTDAILLSELGVGLPIFILGPAIAMHFGEESGNTGTKTSIFAEYFHSPIFFAVALGLIIAPLQIPTDHWFLAPFYEALSIIGNAVAVLACLILGLQLKIKSLKGIWTLLIISAIIQMGLQPWIAHVQAGLYHLSVEQTQVLTLISSMPCAVLGSVFATHYKCASDTTSALIMMHILLSIVLVPLTFAVLNMS
ncbi:MAG: AEC family transporter [Methanothrix sp.]|nr:AEC family transporter [Methanothrix sp.]